MKRLPNVLRASASQIFATPTDDFGNYSPDYWNEAEKEEDPEEWPKKMLEYVHITTWV